MKNTRLLKALRREHVDATPVWFMRQAGRYLPEYKKLREKAQSFMTLCQTPSLAAEATLQPLARFDLDAAIIFSDILTIPDAMGLGLYFTEGEGPRFENPVRTASAINKLSSPDPEQSLRYVMDAIRQVKPSLSVPLIGFSGSPWTLACYMIEGAASKQFSVIKKMLYQEPTVLQQLLTILIQSVTDYLNAQIAAGVDVVMLFDSWGGILETDSYQHFSLNPMTEIIKKLKPNSAGEKIPVIVFTKSGHQWLELIAESGCDAIGVDWAINLRDAKSRVGNRVALQGNLEPAVLYATPDIIRQKVKTLLQDYGNEPGHIFNFGHGILTDIPPDHVRICIDAVHEFSRRD